MRVRQFNPYEGFRSQGYRIRLNNVTSSCIHGHAPKEESYDMSAMES